MIIFDVVYGPLGHFRHFDVLLEVGGERKLLDSARNELAARQLARDWAAKAVEMKQDIVKTAAAKTFLGDDLVGHS